MRISQITGKVFSIVPRSTRFAKLLLLGIFIVTPVARAGQSQADGPKSCVNSQLAGLLLFEGNSIRVRPFHELPGGNAARLDAGVQMTTDDEVVSRRVAKARKVFEKAAKHGSAAAEVNYGVALLSGWGGEPNAGAALYWLHAAADQNFAPAFYDLGMLYFKGCGVHQDYGEAFQYFEKGANAGDSAAQANLGYFYDQGLGISQDRAAAASWYRKAAENGEPLAQYNLADLYVHGEGVALDETTAFGWFQKAALQGHSGARIMLGHLYAAGRGTNKDLAAAYLWFLVAALQGDLRGQAMLASLEHQLTPERVAEVKAHAQSLAQVDKESAELAFVH
jgi:TPR repeat protein